MCDISDFLIFYVDKNIHLCGSYYEFTISNLARKPILCVVKQGKKETPKWIFGCIPHQFLFNSFEEMLSYLNYVDQSEEEPPHFKRWTFFTKYEMMMPKKPYNHQFSNKQYKLKWEEV
jgi:hypothetical protein